MTTIAQITGIDGITIMINILAILILTVSLYFGWKNIQSFPADATIRKYWYVLFGLVVLLIGGAMVGIWIIMSENVELQALMSAIFYLIGSFFVLIVIYISHQTYRILFNKA